MDDVWTDWQTDGWIAAHGHRWSHFFVTTPALVGRRVGYELMNMDLSSGGGKLDTSPQSDFSTLCFQMSPQTTCIRAEKVTGEEYELINSSDWRVSEVGMLTPPPDLIGGEVRSLTPPSPPIG